VGPLLFRKAAISIFWKQAAPFIFLELHEKLPGLSRNPTFTAIIAGNAIHRTVLVSSLKRAEYNGIPAFATRKLSGKVFATGWRQGYSRRYCTAVILEVTKKAIFPALLFGSIEEPLTIWIIRAGRLITGRIAYLCRKEFGISTNDFIQGILLPLKSKSVLNIDTCIFIEEYIGKW
jgi:hypothetical protein